MFCRNCGKEVQDGVKFCPECGSLIIPAASPGAGAQENESADSAPSAAETAEEVPAKKKRRKIWIPIVIIVAAVVVALCLLGFFGAFSGRSGGSGSSRNTVNLNDYISVEYSGYDGYGTAVVHFDSYTLGEDYNDKIQITDEAEDWGFYDFSDVVSSIALAYVNPYTDLSDGDEVTVEWEVHLDFFDEMVKKEVEFTYEPMTFTVEGLEPIQTFDAFAGISVEFSGTSPNAFASIVYDYETQEFSADVWDYLYYSLSRTEGLMIGDTVTVTLDEGSVDDLMEVWGMAPAEFSRDYVVEDVPYYVSSLDQIPEDAIAKMDSQAQDAFNSYVAKNWNVGTLTSLECLGSYFLYPKQPGSTKYQNIVYMAYRYQVRVNDEVDATGYWYCGFFDGILLEDGTYSMDYMNYETTGETFSVSYDEGKRSAKCAGFTDLDSMFNNIVTSKVADYTYESSVRE